MATAQNTLSFFCQPNRLLPLEIYLPWGVVGWRSDFTVENFYFENIHADNFYSLQLAYVPFVRGSAMASVGDKFIPANGSLTVISSSNPQHATVTNSDKGVYTYYSNLEMTAINLVNLNTGIFSMRCKDNLHSHVGGCNITAKNYGIRWLYNAGSSSMHADDNIIHMSGNQNSIGIFAGESSGGVANYNIENNRNITITDGSKGIFVVGAFNPVIAFNTVYQNSSGGNIPPPLGTYGIQTNGCEKAHLSCNGIVSYYPNTVTGSYGMCINGSKSFIIECNGVVGQYQGIYFGGDCSGSDENFRGNTMQNNFSGLYLNSMAKIGVQTKRGNLWINYLDSVGAENHDTISGGLNASKFYVNNTPTQLPNIPPYDVGWFAILPGNYFTCGNTCASQIASGVNDKTYLRLIANDSTTTSDFVPEGKSISKQYLFETLAEDSTLRNSDSVFIDFYNTQVISAIGKLYDAQNRVTQSFTIDPYSASLIYTTDSIIKTKQDSLAIIDSLLQIGQITNYDAVRNSLISEMTLLKHVISNLINQNLVIATGKLNSALIINTAITPDELPEQNQQFANQMTILFEAYGEDTLLYYWNDILSIAMQCPYNGGNAVYIMRNFVALFDDSIVYDDISACLLSGIYRQMQLQTDSTKCKNFKVKNKNQPSVSIIPNPANDKIKILITGTNEGICRIEISNSLGAIKMKDNMNCKEKSHDISTKNFAQGVYTVKVFLNNKYPKISKLIIQR